MVLRLISRKNVYIIILLILAIGGLYIANKFFPFISADTDPITGIELIQKGNFEIVPTFDESIWEKTTNNNKNLAVEIVGKRLVLNEAVDIQDNYLTINQKISLKKAKLYKILVNFETDFPKDITVIGGIRHSNIDSAGKISYVNLQERRLRAVENNKPTTFTSYFSPLKDQENGQFFLTIRDGSGKIKIKKISVIECDRSEVGSLFPDIVSRFLTGLTLSESYYNAVPWNLAEPNRTDGLPAGTVATSSEKAIIYSADVDNLDLNYRPKTTEQISEIKTSLARGELGNNFFTIYAKSDLNNLKLSVSDLSSATSSAKISAQILSVRYRQKQDNDQSWGTYSYKNEIIEPFFLLKKLGSGSNQSIALEVPVSLNEAPGEYKGTISISADGFSKTLPVTITINKFTLSELTSSRLLMLQTDDRWQRAWKNDPDQAKKQIESEVRSALFNGFNSMTLSEHIGNISGYSMIEQYSRKYPKQMKYDPTNLVSGFNLSDSNKYALKMINQITSEKNGYVGDNVFSLQTILYYILYLNGRIDGEIKGGIITPSITSSDFSNIWDKIKDEPKDGVIAKQLISVLNDIRDQNNQAGEKYWDKFQFYFIDEAGAGNKELDIGLWMDKVVKSAGYKTYFTGNKNLVESTVSMLTPENNIKTYALQTGVGIIDQNTVLSLKSKNITPSVYSGVYTSQDGNRLRNRYIAGYLSKSFGIDEVFAWQYMLYGGLNSSDPSKRFDDFDRKSLSWFDGGREWNLEYLDDASYRDSYKKYYGIEIEKTDQTKNISTLQFLGFKEADNDLRYLATAKKIVGASILPSKTTDLAEVDKILSDLPAGARTIYGENVSNKILDQKRARLSELIAKHYVSVNQPPVLSAIGNKEVVAEKKLIFDISASDPDGDAVFYSASGLPNGATFSGQKFSWTPNSSQVGNYKITFNVSDGKLTDSEEMTITVKSTVSPPAINHPPVMSLIGDKKVEEMHILDFSVLASDSDGDTLTYAVDNLPDGATFNIGTRRFAWTPDYTQSGIYSGIHFSVSDAEFTVYEDVTIKVDNLNRAPTLSTIGNKEIAIDSNLTFNVYGSDYDGDKINYSVTNLPAGAVFSGQNFSWTPNSSQIGNYKVNFKISDGGLFDSEEINIEVKTVSSRPPDPTFETGDINHDTRVDLLDLSIIASHWSASGAGQVGGDINADGVVDLLDLSIVASQWEG